MEDIALGYVYSSFEDARTFSSSICIYVKDPVASTDKLLTVVLSLGLQHQEKLCSMRCTPLIHTHRAQAGSSHLRKLIPTGHALYYSR